MLQFDEEQELKKVDDLKKKEEEELVEMLATQKYQIPCINLAGVQVENEAIRAVPEEDARRIEVAPFKIVGKTAVYGVSLKFRKSMGTLQRNFLC